MSVITVLVVFVVLAVLLFTCEAYAEIPVLLITFGSAALVQMGTNFLLGTIEFIFFNNGFLAFTFVFNHQFFSLIFNTFS